MLGLRLRCVALATLLGLAAAPPVEGQAHFWLSDKMSGSSGPEAPSSSLSVGDTKTYYLWGRPTDGRQFEAISLNVVASATGIDFVDGSYVFHNEISGSVDRFEHTRDSSTTPDLESFASDIEVGFGAVDALLGINAFTQNDSAAYRGMGPTCADGETACEIAADGQPAWLIATFNVAAVSAGSVDLYLQIGDRGILEREMAEGDYDMAGETENADHTVWADSYGSTTLLAADGTGDGVVDAADYTVWRDHSGDLSTILSFGDTSVRFGVDAGASNEPAHSASTDRELNLPGDDPDVTLTISAPAVSVPEPSAALLALGAGLISSGRRRPTRRR
ncbi:hypothetical protein MalM25_18560 [Planctomycetes bacterium MalM25]|nr:hypothetical protein MalM25_18560 [Planctomycetes bacterium MalM25]